MAREIVICDVLCFISNNFDKLTVGHFKPILLHFYNDDKVCAAKDTLLKAVYKLLKAMLICHAFRNGKVRTRLLRQSTI